MESIEIQSSRFLDFLNLQAVRILVEINVLFAVLQFSTLEIDIVGPERPFQRVEHLVMVAVRGHPVLVQTAEIERVREKRKRDQGL